MLLYKTACIQCTMWTRNTFLRSILLDQWRFQLYDCTFKFSVISIWCRYARKTDYFDSYNKISKLNQQNHLTSLDHDWLYLHYHFLWTMFTIFLIAVAQVMIDLSFWAMYRCGDVIVYKLMYFVKLRFGDVIGWSGIMALWAV